MKREGEENFTAPISCRIQQKREKLTNEEKSETDRKMNKETTKGQKERKMEEKTMTVKTDKIDEKIDKRMKRETNGGKDRQRDDKADKWRKRVHYGTVRYGKSMTKIS